MILISNKKYYRYGSNKDPFEIILDSNRKNISVLDIILDYVSYNGISKFTKGDIMGFLEDNNMSYVYCNLSTYNGNNYYSKDLEPIENKIEKKIYNSDNSRSIISKFKVDAIIYDRSVQENI